MFATAIVSRTLRQRHYVTNHDVTLMLEQRPKHKRKYLPAFFLLSGPVFFTSLDIVVPTLPMSNLLFASRWILTFAPFHSCVRNQRPGLAETLKAAVGWVTSRKCRNETPHYAVDAVVFVVHPLTLHVSKIVKYFMFRLGTTSRSCRSTFGC